MKESYDVVVVGAGIAGLAVAYECASVGKRVLVCERDPSAKGASIRNFGMVWPIGQPPGRMRTLAMRSRTKWLEVLGKAGLWHQRTGSLHLAHRQDELDVLQEFCDKGSNLDYEVQMLTRNEVLSLCPSLRTDWLLGGLWSPHEVCVNPREVVAELPNYLRSVGVEFAFSLPVCEVESGLVVTSKGRLRAKEIYICTGGEFETLFPQLFSKHQIVRCKLQMLRAKPKAPDFRMGPMLCAGLTLGHYTNFGICSKLPALVQRMKSEYPLHDKWKIHVLVSQHQNGELTIGDSHEYGDNPMPFNREEIDRLILDYLDTFLPVEDLEIVERWNGVYPKCMTAPYVVEHVMEGVTAVIGLGGAGMTLSFGIAEEATQSVALCL